MVWFLLSLPRLYFRFNTIADAIQAIAGRNAYVNIHTNPFPGGEIRGPLSASAEGAADRVRYDPFVTHTVSSALVTVALAGLAGGRYEPTLDARAISEAIAIGQSRIEAQRTAFHQRYRTAVNRPPVDYVEVVTPFRRVEMAAEAHARGGDQRWGQRDALQILAETGGEIELFIELTFHPLNTYVGVPAYAVNLVHAGSGAAPAVPREIRRVPRLGARVDGTTPFPVPAAPPSAGGPMLGGTVIAVFDGAQLAPNGFYDVVVSEAGKELARARINLGNLR